MNELTTTISFLFAFLGYLLCIVCLFEIDWSFTLCRENVSLVTPNPFVTSFASTLELYLMILHCFVNNAIIRLFTLASSCLVWAFYCTERNRVHLKISDVSPKLPFEVLFPSDKTYHRWRECKKLLFFFIFEFFIERFKYKSKCVQGIRWEMVFAVKRLLYY